MPKLNKKPFLSLSQHPEVIHKKEPSEFLKTHEKTLLKNVWLVPTYHQAWALRAHKKQGVVLTLKSITAITLAVITLPSCSILQSGFTQYDPNSPPPRFVHYSPQIPAPTQVQPQPTKTPPRPEHPAHPMPTAPNLGHPSPVAEPQQPPSSAPVHSPDNDMHNNDKDEDDENK